MRQLSRVILKLVVGEYRPDTGRTVQIYTTDPLPALVATATESPAGTAQYLASWTEQLGYGQWYVDAVAKPEWGNIWLGTVVGSENYLGDFKVIGNLAVTGSVAVSGSVTAAAFIGDGSGLTNVTGSLTNNHAGLTNLDYASSGHTGFESVVNAQFVSGNLVTRINSVTGSLTQNHAGLTNLDYASAGHTGFESQVNTQFVSGNLESHINAVNTNVQFVSGNLVARINNVTGSLTNNHAGLTNLSYATSGHTGFAGVGTNNFAGNQAVTGSIIVTQRSTSGVVYLSDDATVATDASLGNTFVHSGSSGRTFAAPTNPLDGQRVLYRLANTGSIPISHIFASGSGGIRWGADITGSAPIAAGKTNYLGIIYNASANYFDAVAQTSGY